MPLEPLLPLFHRLDREHFEGSLAAISAPPLALRWSDGRMRRTAGLYRRGRDGAGREFCDIVLSRPLLASLLGKLESKFDLVLVDTSAAMVFSDSKSVAFRAGSALVLARKNHTRIADTNAMIRELHDTGTRIVGTVINAF